MATSKVSQKHIWFVFLYVEQPSETIRSMFTKPKDKPGKNSSTAIFYKIYFKNSEKVYIGQTKCTLKTRTKEHRRAIFPEDKNSLLAQHRTQTKHVFDLENVHIIDKIWLGLFLEA